MTRARAAAAAAPAQDPALALVIRPAFPDDAADVARLAALDEAPVPPGPLLLAEIRGELWAAVSLQTLEHIAHPFAASAPVTALALQRARQLTGPRHPGRAARRRAARRRSAP